MLKDILYKVFGLIADAHEWILTLNDAYEYHFSDKQLHFLTIGILGMLLLFLIHPVFILLVKTDHILVISWLYVITVIMGLTLSIEIGQKITGTGIMELSDIVFGIGGFFLMFLVFAFIRAIVLLIIDEVKVLKNKPKHTKRNK